MASINAGAPKRTVVNLNNPHKVKILDDQVNVSVVESKAVTITEGSLFSDDVSQDRSDIGNFSGELSAFFDNIASTKIDETGLNPKTIKFGFTRTIQTQTIGLGCDDTNYNFSNVKIKFLGSGDVVKFVWDGTDDSTKRNSYLIELPAMMINGIIIEFHTEDVVGLSNIFISKLTDTRAQLAAIRDDQTVTGLSSTDSGSLRVQVTGDNSSDNLAVTNGGVGYRRTHDVISAGYLEQILQELQKMNEQLSLITDEEL